MIMFFMVVMVFTVLSLTWLMSLACKNEALMIML